MTREIANTAARTTTTPKTSTPSWCAAERPPPKRSPLGSAGRSGSGGELCLGEEGDHEDPEDPADEVAGEEPDRVGVPTDLGERLFGAQEDGSTEKPEDDRARPG